MYFASAENVTQDISPDEDTSGDRCKTGFVTREQERCDVHKRGWLHLLLRREYGGSTHQGLDALVLGIS